MQQPSTIVKKAVYLRRIHKFPLSYRSPCAKWQGQIWYNARGFADSSNGERRPADFCSQQKTEMTTNLFLTIDACTLATNQLPYNIDITLSIFSSSKPTENLKTCT